MSLFDLHRARLLAGTVQHLTAAQLRVRARRMAKRRVSSLLGTRVKPATGVTVAAHHPLWRALEKGDPLPKSREVQDAIARAQRAAAGRFRFLSREIPYGGPPDWHDPKVPHLWRYNLHYFDYVDDLAIWFTSGARALAYEAFRTLVRSWIEANARLGGDGWHPYTISRRVPNWVHALAVFRDELAYDPRFTEELNGSLYAQLRFLFDDIEFDVRGNHLIANLRALVYGGVAYEGSEAQSWVDTALDILRDEVAEQVAGDGGHFERTPAYHALVLRDLLEIAILLRRNREVPSWLDDAIRRMSAFLDGMVMADGNLPLIKDTTWDGIHPHVLLSVAAIYTNDPDLKRTPSVALYPWLLFGDGGAERLEATPLNEKPRETTWYPSSALAVVRDASRGLSLIVDAGPPCPPYLPAHAHADMFSFELCVDGRRVIVDSGVGTYEEGEWRDYFRSTAAHNTVEVDGENQSEVWGSFRVARRAMPKNVSFEQSSLGVVIRGEHDGYRRLRTPVTHRRTIVHRHGITLVVDDLLGRGTVQAASFVHFHPGVPQEEAVRLVTTFGQDVAWREQSYYSERFGERVQNAVLTIRRGGALPLRFGYVIAPEPVPIQFDGRIVTAAGVTVTSDGKAWFDR